MSTSQGGTGPDQVSTPTVSTAPTSGTADAPHTSWWHWDALPHHLGRARTSTVILSVLFVGIFALYLNVRPDVPTDTTPRGGGSDVQVPANPVLPTAPTTTPEPTEEPAPTTEPEETETPSDDTGTPTTGSTTSSPDSGTTEPTTEPTSEPSDPTETSEPTSPTDGTTTPSTASPSPTG